MEGSKDQVELLMMYEEVKKELDQYKTAHDKLTAGLKEAVAESTKYKHERDELSEKLDKECNLSLNIEGQLHDMTKQRDELIKDLSNYRRVLKVFARLIKNKLAINASGRYIQYQHMLDDIGINADELEGE